MGCKKCEHTGFSWGYIPCECVTGKGTKSQDYLPEGTKICAIPVYSDTMEPWEHNPYLNLCIISRVENVGAYIHEKSKGEGTSKLAFGHLKYKDVGLGKIHRDMFVPGYLAFIIGSEELTRVLILDKNVIRVIEDVNS